MIINHNCCIKLVPLLIFIYDAQSHIYQILYALLIVETVFSILEVCPPLSFVVLDSLIVLLMPH